MMKPGGLRPEAQKLSKINELKKKVKKIELCTLRMHTKSCTLNFRYYYILCYPQVAVIAKIHKTKIKLRKNNALLKQIF